MRQLRLIVGASTVLIFGAALSFVGFGVRAGQIPWPVLVGALAVLGATEWFFWNAVKPPTLKADATQIFCIQTVLKQRMPRSEVNSIFRGQKFAQTRNGSYWYKCYLFVASDGKVGITCSASDFEADSIAQFAQRLQIPIRGDFSSQVKHDRVEVQPV